VTKQILQPPGWRRPRGYANGVAASGRLVFVAGQVGWVDGSFASDDLVEQIRQALVNTLAVLAVAGAAPRHVARMTWYITDKRAYLASTAEIGRVWRALMGDEYPAMAMVEVTALIEDRALVEIETTAVIPEGEQHDRDLSRL
jgi:enamine deaminase RidA (YjgF/YER057c/UK114 family)